MLAYLLKIYLAIDIICINYIGYLKSSELNLKTSQDVKEIKPFGEEFYQQRKISKKEAMIRDKFLEKSKKVIDSYCSKLSDDCFDIIDEYFIGFNSNKLLAARTIYTNHSESGLRLTVSLVEPPTPLTWNNLDSRKWTVRKDYIDLLYPILMITNSFMTGTLKPGSSRVYKILLIGFGGGLIPNYFSTLDYIKTNITSVEIDPVMEKISKKWFGFEETSTSRLIIDDGLEYFKFAEKNKEKYDVIILDACPNKPDPSTGLFCPLKEILDERVLRRINKLLARNGTLIINFIAVMRDQIQKRVNSSVSAVFNDCYQEEISNQESMITCSNTAGNNPYANPQLFNERYKRLRPHLNIVPYHAELRYKEMLPKGQPTGKVPRSEDWARDEL